MTTSNQPNVRITPGQAAPVKRATARPSRKFSNAQQANQLTHRLDTVLLDITNSRMTELDVRQTFRKIAIESTRSIGACHLIRTEGGSWTRDTQHVTGRVPDAREIEEVYAERCEAAFVANGVQSFAMEQPKNAVALLAPIRAVGAAPEVLMLVNANAAAVANCIRMLNRVAMAMQLWLKGDHGHRMERENAMLAAMTEVVTHIEACDTTKQAAGEVVNEIVRELGCANAAIGLLHGKKLKLESVSGVHKIDKASDTGRNYLQALRESITRGEPAHFPAIDSDNNHLLLSHRQLAVSLQNESIYSHPLIDSDGKTIGAWLFTGPGRQVHDPAFTRFVDTASPKVTSALQILKRAEKGRLKRAISFVRRKTSWFSRLMIPLGIFGLVMLMMMPVTYRVRCKCTAEAVARRFAVAPFDGLVVSGYAEPGDRVSKDQVLAEIDGRSILWELSGITAERKQSLRQREIKLAEGNIPETFLAELENERLTSKEEILKFKRDHLQIKSPVDGVVLSGSLERAEAASITTGQVLFEIGPLKPMRLEIAIPANDIAQVKIGHPATIWIEGQEDQPLEGEIARIHPRSETRDAKNVFVAEIEFSNDDERLRPGMKGSVRIDTEQRSLGWTLFHKPVNYLRSRFTWW